MSCQLFIFSTQLIHSMLMLNEFHNNKFIKEGLGLKKPKEPLSGCGLNISCLMNRKSTAILYI